MKIIGHEAALNYIERVPVAQFPQTLLFVGPRAVGKTLVAHVACARLLGCTPEAAVTHPQIIRLIAGVDPKTGNPRATIPVAAIRELRSLFSMHQSGPRIILIERAEELNQEASNALLKVMEEPIPQLYFMILTRSQDGVLQTIRSRAARLTLSPVSAAELRAALAQYTSDAAEIERVMIIAEGRPGIAFAYFTDAEFKERIIRERARFERLRATHLFCEAEPILADLFGKKERHIEARGELAEMLEWWLAWLRRSSPDHPVLAVIAATIPRLFENMHPRLLIERVVIALQS